MAQKKIRQKINKYLSAPVAKIDLHGCTRREAEEELARFFNYWLDQGGGVKLLVITGQGHHSTAPEGVIKPFTTKWLKDRGYHQRPAKPQYGGNGAIEVDLPIFD